MDYIFSAEQIEVPKDLAGITKAWTKEVIRNMYLLHHQHRRATMANPSNNNELLR
jgi:hypothetical protein